MAHRRIEVNAFRRRVTVVSGEWPRDDFDAQLVRIDEEVLLNDLDSSETVTVDSPEGQLIIAEAVRSLEQRLTLNARSTIPVAQNVTAPNGSRRNAFCVKMELLYQLIRQQARRATRSRR